MKNVDMRVDGDKLVITVDLTKDFGRSKSGKTNIIASTEGNQPVPDHPAIFAGVNIYTKK